MAQIEIVGNAFSGLAFSEQHQERTMPDHTITSFSLNHLNGANQRDACAMMEKVTERSPWLANRIVEARPFPNAQALAARIEAEIVNLSKSDALMLLRAHPKLAPNAPHQMTTASQNEQSRLALALPRANVSGQLRILNAAYAKRHGFPFIVALHKHQTIESVISQFESRLGNETQHEMNLALAEVASVASARIVQVLEPDNSETNPHLQGVASSQLRKDEK